MPKRLDQLHVAQVHAVDKGANGRKILLRKAAVSKGEPTSTDVHQDMPLGGKKKKKMPPQEMMEKALDGLRNAFEGLFKVAAKTGMTQDLAAEDGCPNCCEDSCACACHDGSQCCDDCCAGGEGCSCACHGPACTKCCGGQDGCKCYCHRSESHCCSTCCSGPTGCGCECHAAASLAKSGRAITTPGDEPVTKEAPPMAGDPTPVAKTATPATPEVLTKADFEARLTEIQKAHDAQVADLTKRADDAVSLAKAEKDARETSKAIQKAKDEMPHLPGISADQLGPILKALGAGEPLTAEQATQVETVLKASSEAVRKSDLLKEAGAGGSAAGGDAWAKIEAVAKSLQEKDASLTLAKAITKAIEQNQALYAEYQAEKKGN